MKPTNRKREPEFKNTRVRIKYEKLVMKDVDTDE